MHTLRTGGLIPAADACAPVGQGADGAGHKAACAIGADVVQHLLHTGRTKGTFIGADARIRRLSRQVLVAHLAVRFEDQHGVLS